MPFLIYAPGLIPEPRVIDRVVNSVDILPTLAGLIGIPHRNTTLGRDMFEERPPDAEFSFCRFGITNDEFYYHQRLDQLFRHHSETPALDVSDQYPDQIKKMRRLWWDLYETSRYMLYHNKSN